MEIEAYDDHDATEFSKLYPRPKEEGQRRFKKKENRRQEKKSSISIGILDATNDKGERFNTPDTHDYCSMPLSFFLDCFQNLFE
eukprot:scaffold6345_cov155-Amphora_coffeaeformis.AAC.7